MAIGTYPLEDILLGISGAEAAVYPTGRYSGDVHATTGTIGNMMTQGELEIASVLKLTGKEEVVISSGEITASTARVRVNTEGGASSDDLVTITPPSTLLSPEGTLMLLEIADDNRAVIVKHHNGGGNIHLASGSEFRMESKAQKLLVLYDEDHGHWIEVSRAGDPVPATFPPFGLPAWSENAADDATISGNTTLTDPIKVYRDLTIASGVVLTGSTPYQVIACRILTFGSTSSAISADALGQAGGGASARGGRGSFGASLPDDIYAQATLVAGGAGGAVAGTTAAGEAGASASAGVLALISDTLRFTVRGGAGGGAGAIDQAAIALQDGGVFGANGNQTGTTQGSGGGGSGVAGGGGGGGKISGSGNAGVTGGASLGGAGGGIIIVVCREVAGAAGIVRANGAAGGNGLTDTGHGAGGGGGGGGMAVLFHRDANTATPTVTATGGAAGTASGADARAGGAGGTGVARLIRSG